MSHNHWKYKKQPQGPQQKTTATMDIKPVFIASPERCPQLPVFQSTESLFQIFLFETLQQQKC